jgi:hypothetical protein
VRPHSSEPWKAVFELRKLNLEPSLVGLGAAGKDIEDQRGPVDDLDLERLFEIAKLGGWEFIVDQDDIVSKALAKFLDLVELPGTNVMRVVRMGERLSDRADDVKAGGLGELGKFFQGGCGIPIIMPPIDGDKERPFRRGIGFVRLCYGCQPLFSLGIDYMNVGYT